MHLNQVFSKSNVKVASLESSNAGEPVQIPTIVRCSDLLSLAHYVYEIHGRFTRASA